MLAYFFKNKTLLYRGKLNTPPGAEEFSAGEGGKSILINVQGRQIKVEVDLIAILLSFTRVSSSGVK
jgi:hypothetical protein